MASAPSAEDKNAERRKRVLLGALPPDFLRVSVPELRRFQHVDPNQHVPEQRRFQHVDPNQHAVLAVQQQLQLLSEGTDVATNPIGRLSVTFVQARLAKNYGLLQMDPFVRLRVGHFVYETQTANSGGKTPKWNKVVQCLLPKGVNTINLEIYDECSFSENELIAWANIPISEEVMNGETKEGWFELNGKQGKGLEGMINLVLSFTDMPVGPSPVYPRMQSLVMVPSPTAFGGPAYQSVYGQPTPVTRKPPPPHKLTEEELKLFQEMFPNIEKGVIKAVAQENHGNKCATINALLAIGESTPPPQYSIL